MAGEPKDDGRVRAVAAQQVLTWAFGKPPDYDPREDKAAVKLNLAVLSTEEKRLLLAMLRRGLVSEEGEAPPLEEHRGAGERPRVLSDATVRHAAVRALERSGQVVTPTELDLAAASDAII
jgi:hypothetical protein